MIEIVWQRELEYERQGTQKNQAADVRKGVHVIGGTARGKRNKVRAGKRNDLGQKEKLGARRKMKL